LARLLKKNIPQEERKDWRLVVAIYAPCPSIGFSLLVLKRLKPTRAHVRAKTKTAIACSSHRGFCYGLRVLLLPTLPYGCIMYYTGALFFWVRVNTDFGCGTILCCTVQKQYAYKHCRTTQTTVVFIIQQRPPGVGGAVLRGGLHLVGRFGCLGVFWYLKA
jgi:hypothetical protein